MTLAVLLLGELDGGLDSGVAAADDEHALAVELLRVDEPIEDLALVFAGHPELARRTAQADGEDDGAATDGRALLGLDDEVAALAVDADDALALVDDEVGLLQHGLQLGEQLLLRQQRAAEAPVEGQLDGLAHHDLAAGIVGDAAAEALLLEDAGHEALLATGHRGGDAGRAAADDDDVDDVATLLVRAAARARIGLLEAFAEGAADLGALAQGVLDEAHAAELADDEDAGATRLERVVGLGQIDPALGGAKDEADGADRALDGAAGVADAVGPLHQRGHAVDDADDVALRAGLDAREAADAEVRIDDRVQRRRQVLTLLDREGQGGAAALLVGATAQEHRPHHREQDEGDDAGEQRALGHRVHVSRLQRRRCRRRRP